MEKHEKDNLNTKLEDHKVSSHKLESHKVEDKYHHKKNIFNNKFYTNLFLFIGVILIVLTLFNIFQGRDFSMLFDEKMINAKENLIPAELQLVVINTPKCEGCFDIMPLVDSIKKQNVNITEEIILQSNSEQAKKLIDKYNIEKLPTLLISGEIEKLKIKGLEEREGRLIFTELNPPYFDAKSGRILGRVSTILLKDSSCKECIDFNSVLNTLEQSGVVLGEHKILEKSTSEAQKLINNFNLEKLPTLLISDDVEMYSISEKMKASGLLKQNSFFVVESPAPYVEIKTGDVRGLVKVTLITDLTCDNCYDVNMHKEILTGMNMALNEEKIVDINSAEGLKLKILHNLVKVPTVIITGDLDAYTGFDQVWKQVGTIELNGAYVFRNLELLGPGIIYKDLLTGKVVQDES